MKGNEVAYCASKLFKACETQSAKVEGIPPMKERTGYVCQSAHGRAGKKQKTQNRKRTTEHERKDTKNEEETSRVKYKEMYH